MPILLPAQPDAPLDQGDVLYDITTFVGGEADPLANLASTVMVISRPCNAVRDKNVTVALISKCDLKSLEGLETLQDYVGFFRAYRDGDGRPDCFYLGETAPGSSERFMAKFDALYTIRIPDEAEARRQFLVRHRRFHMHPDFKRDLHQRLFRSFASLGFDDESWWSDEDLKFLVGIGQRDLIGNNAEIERSRLDIAAQALATNPQKAQNVTSTDVKHAEKARQRTEDMLAPLLAEQARRVSSSGGEPSAGSEG